MKPKTAEQITQCGLSKCPIYDKCYTSPYCRQQIRQELIDEIEKLNFLDVETEYSLDGEAFVHYALLSKSKRWQEFKKGVTNGQ